MFHQIRTEKSINNQENHRDQYVLFIFHISDILLKYIQFSMITSILLILFGVNSINASTRSCFIKDRLPVYRDYFYIGGEYVFDAFKNGSFMTGQMYVEHLTPPYGIRMPYPLILIHGNALTGAFWLNTPDGRPGWASYFLNQGYEVYIVDQTARGRSILLPNRDVNINLYSVETLEARFTATNVYQLWPQSVLHTQWPGANETTKGRKGDPMFDAFYASTVQFVADDAQVQLMMQKAGAALLDKIGPAILLTHSQSGPIGWLIGDARPDLVKAILSIEPKGPPFREVIFSNTSTRAWGLADIPLTYDPVFNSSSPLFTIEVPSNDSKLTPCILQQEPIHKLVQLVNISILVQTAEASYHAVYDQCTVAFLKQAGVNVDFMRLEDYGIYGNGHLLMLEKNNLDIAQILHDWIIKNVH